MNILCIDPGTKESGFVVLLRNGDVLDKGIKANPEMVQYIKCFNSLHDDNIVIIEMVASYGMPVGKTVFDTVVWIGIFKAIAESRNIKVVLQTRKETKKTISSGQAKDSHIRQALLDRYPLVGGGATPQIGTKKEPGQLYGVSKHMWAALALGHAYLDGCKEYQLY